MTGGSLSPIDIQSRTSDEMNFEFIIFLGQF